MIVKYILNTDQICLYVRWFALRLNEHLLFTRTLTSIVVQIKCLCVTTVIRVSTHKIILLENNLPAITIIRVQPNTAVLIGDCARSRSYREVLF